MDKDKTRHYNERKQEQLETEDGSSKRLMSEVCRVPTSIERNLIVIIAILVAIGIGLTIALAHSKKENYRNSMKLKAARNDETQMEVLGHNENEICYTPSCVTEASNLMKSMDLTVDPCTDFYSFVCGNWIKNAYLSSSVESQFTKIQRTIQLRVKEILEDLKKVKHLPDHKRKVADFYRGCMDKGHRDVLGARELLSDLEKLGGWPLIKEDWNPSAFSWSDLMVDLFKKGYIHNILFSINVDVDAKNTSRSLISVRNPTLGLKIYEDELGIESYKEVIFKLAKLLKGGLDEEKGMEAIENAFEISKSLRRICQYANWEYIDNIMTLEELEEFAPMIPWRKLLQNLLPYGTELSDEERIKVTAPSMLRELNDILDELNSSNDGKEALANFMFYRTVLHASRHLSKKFYVLINNLLDSEKCVLWEECVKETMDFFPSSLAASYVAKYMDNTTKHHLEEMLDDLKSSLISDIKQSGWLDDETKEYALLKIGKMRSVIAYRDEIMDDATLNNFYKDIYITDNHFNNVKQATIFKLKKSMEGLHDVRVIFRWITVNDLLTANAYYYLAQNTIILPVGLLQDTIFAPGRPNYITYGSLGLIFGHELNHAFDNTGCLYDAEGNYKTWWSPNSWKKFEERTECFKNQYSKYYIPAAGAFVDGQLTLGENMADNGGLQTAYKAYKKTLKRTGSEKLLPGLPYNARQMFWISYASVWCKRGTDESIRWAMTDEHTPSQFRVIGTLSNMREFAQDFNCKLNSNMNPRSKCSLWQ